MKIQAYKCKVTGKVFETKDRAKYILHLKKVREKQKEDRLHKRIREEFNIWLANERNNIFDIIDIPDWFLKNQRYIMDATNAITFRNSKDYEKFQPTDTFCDISFRYAIYSPLTSNSHTCPDNGVTNWCERDKDAPIGYPGWNINIGGTLKRLLKHNDSYPYSKALNLVGIKTGTGGGGNEHWGYEASIFVEDWPGLGQGLVMNKLRGVK